VVCFAYCLFLNCCSNILSTKIFLSIHYDANAIIFLMHTKKAGFTIVELLIVIVIIGILAAITTVAYSGVQARAENTKTVHAVSTWAKALQMYKVDKGNYPTMHSCLGGTNTYTSSFSGRCYGSETDGTWIVQQTFLNEMTPYIKSFPSPSDKNAYTNVNQHRGAIYYRESVGTEKIFVTLLNVSTCPDIGGLGASYDRSNLTNGKTCYYNLPQ